MTDLDIRYFFQQNLKRRIKSKIKNIFHIKKSINNKTYYFYSSYCF